MDLQLQLLDAQFEMQLRAENRSQGSIANLAATLSQAANGATARRLLAATTLHPLLLRHEPFLQLPRCCRQYLGGDQPT